jgi:hypothetical protein
MLGSADWIFALLLVFGATWLMIFLAERGRGRLRILVLWAIFGLSMAVNVLCMNSLPIFGWSHDIRHQVGLVAILIGYAALLAAGYLLRVELTARGRWPRMPIWLYNWLYGASDRQPPSSGE